MAWFGFSRTPKKIPNFNILVLFWSSRPQKSMERKEKKKKRMEFYSFCSISDPVDSGKKEKQFYNFSNTLGPQTKHIWRKCGNYSIVALFRVPRTRKKEKKGLKFYNTWIVFGPRRLLNKLRKNYNFEVTLGHTKNPGEKKKGDENFIISALFSVPLIQGKKRWKFCNFRVILGFWLLEK